MVIILLAGCKPDLPVEDTSFCPGCLQGNWELVSCVKLNENDTVEKFEKGRIYYYSKGVKEPYDKSASLVLKFNNESFTYLEVVNDSDLWQSDTLTFTENWVWLNAGFSKTFLKIQLRWGSLAFRDVARVVKLTAQALELEYKLQYGISVSMHLTFKRAADSPVNTALAEEPVRQLPGEIAGTWKLHSFFRKTNDSVFTVYSGDTVTNQEYQTYYSHYGPPIVRKEIQKHFYRQTIELAESGITTGKLAKDSTTINISNYWYWVDEQSPHRRINLNPFVTGTYSNDYTDVVRFSGDTLVLRYLTTDYFWLLVR